LDEGDEEEGLSDMKSFLLVSGKTINGLALTDLVDVGRDTLGRRALRADD